MTSPYYTAAGRVFEDVAREHATRPALRWSAAESTTYGELDALSNRIARLLMSRGARKRDPVCLCVEKSLTAYAAIVACVKIGSPYFVVDPGHPPARTRTMVERCRPVLAFADGHADRSPLDCPVIDVDDSESIAPQVAGFADAPVRPDWTIDGSDPAYIMFTSGSTGTPKGVTISHQNLVNFIAWSRTEFETRPDDVFTNVNPLFFDNSVFDIYSSVFTGASLVPFTAAVMRDPRAIVSRIDDLQCTVYFSVPSLLVYLQTVKLVTETSFPSLRTIMFGGEGYPRPMLAKLFAAVGRRVALYNVYGPTECTCICSVHRVSAADVSVATGYAPLGRLIPNFSHVVIDEHGRPVAPGATGELCLGGPCVGLGYYRDPEQTVRTFVQNPAHDRFFDRVYKTGDLVREDPADGTLHFVGRNDTQIKHQGYRIELGEIEHALASIDGVDEAAAVYQTNGSTGRIVAVVASRQSLASAALKRALAALVPKYMVPETVIVTDRLLKNANGKIDRKAILASVEHTTI